jgi:hypothetical protein
MDPDAIAGMVFTLILVLFIGGFILLFPLVKRLGAYIDTRIDLTRGATAGLAGAPQAQLLEQLTQISESLQRMEAEVKQLAERQDFTENLLADREREQRRLLPPEQRQG